MSLKVLDKREDSPTPELAGARASSEVPKAMLDGCLVPQAQPRLSCE